MLKQEYLIGTKMENLDLWANNSLPGMLAAGESLEL
jgi:hypothetical protein